MRGLVILSLLWALPALADPGNQWIAEQPARVRDFGPVVKLSAGGAAMTLFDAGAGGGALSLSVGQQTTHYAFYGTTDLLVGSTRFRLPIEHAKGGFAIERRWSRARLGLGQEWGAIFIQRATGNSGTLFGTSSMASATVGAYGFASYDLVENRRGTPFVSVRAGGDYAPSLQTFLFEASLSLGIRL